jgi:hypothetical protein
MPRLSSFDYALVRLVPHVDREEFINVGVVLFCRTERFLAARIALPAERLAALAPHLSPEQFQPHLKLIPRICQGDAGPLGQLNQAERFHWLVHPRSTVIQPSPVHSGLCADPAAALEHIFETMIRANSSL